MKVNNFYWECEKGGMGWKELEGEGRIEMHKLGGVIKYENMRGPSQMMLTWSKLKEKFELVLHLVFPASYSSFKALKYVEK